MDFETKGSYICLVNLLLFDRSLSSENLASRKANLYASSTIFLDNGNLNCSFDFSPSFFFFHCAVAMGHQLETTQSWKNKALPPTKTNPTPRAIQSMDPGIDEDEDNADNDEEEAVDFTDSINPRTMINHEYRQRTEPHQVGQWYFDEFSGLYRHIAPDNANHFLEDTAANIRQSTSTASHSPLTSQHRVGSSMATGSTSTFDDRYKRSWVIPKTIEEIYALRKKARKTGDRWAQLELCYGLMQAGWLISPSSQDDQLLRKKDKKKLDANELMLVEAQRTLKRLATVGQGIGKTADSEAQYLLANCYGMGALGLPIDHERAFLWYVQASKQNHHDATYRTAVCHELGIGTRKDNNRAMIFYRKGAHLTHVPSMYKLGMILLRGYCGQTPQRREAVSWLQRAASVASSDNPHALHAMAMIQLNGECNDSNFIADPAYAVELLHEAATLGYAPSQVKLGELYEHGELVEVDDSLSIYWYTRAAQQASAEAALALSGWYLTGSPDVLQQSDREAYLWARRAASISGAERWTLAKAFYTVGFYIEKGIGTDQNIDKAKLWYKEAANMGHRSAATQLEQLQKLEGQDPPPETRQPIGDQENGEVNDKPSSPQQPHHPQRHCTLM
ncbi:uncharacterized protein BYT42DRAFT_564725 [Radiomyces spectabilis]|uniref:uncharacterized protein n=1 Tax=Radiomyces spectabilis TaxID=64574 RepID=UPI00221FCDB6|nr:uncharacterized protein BYT42DRAFT_564725 [Radiomyces spectabilis]KAI8380941.1 hypothetical protein BYT42DRAFT_564725 [Radiomyces spectabilis]